MPFKKTLLHQCKNRAFEYNLFGTASTVQNLGGTNFPTSTPSPDLAVTNCTRPPGSRLARLSRRQSHQRTRHRINDWLLRLITHVPFRGWELPPRDREGAAGTAMGTSQLCVWVSGAVSKVLCYVLSFMGWAVSQQHTSVNHDPRSRLRPPPIKKTLHHANAPYHQHHWSKTPTFTMKRKLNGNHVLGMGAVSSTSSILKHMKTQLCISSL